MLLNLVDMELIPDNLSSPTHQQHNYVIHCQTLNVTNTQHYCCLCRLRELNSIIQLDSNLDQSEEDNIEEELLNHTYTVHHQR